MRGSFLGVSLLLTVVALAALPAASQTAQGTAVHEQIPTILFVCEHGAAKSVIAAAYFDKFAKERGLNYRAIFRGTQPDPVIAPVAEKGLAQDGLSTQGWRPQLITKKDMETAASIVTLGCALPDKEAVAGKVIEWNGISSVSENYQVARTEIKQRVEKLVDELTKQSPTVKGSLKTKP
jgi:arsenate reductase (thioredoxin)